MKIKSVADQINKALKASDGSEDDSDGSNFDNSARIVDFDQDEYEHAPSKSTDFRKKNVKLLSEQSNRYKGKIVSRKELSINDDDDDSSENNGSSDGEEESDADETEPLKDGGSKRDSEDVENESEMEDNESEEDEYSLDSEGDNNQGSVSENKKQEEIRKGANVQNQLRLWERLLELRIRTQKLLSKSNELPFPATSENYSSNMAREATENTCILLKNLFELKYALTSQFPELKMHMKRPLQETSAFENYTSGEPPFKRIASQLEDQHNCIRSFRNSVLLKWDDRIKLLAPGAGSKKKISEEIDVVRKIENALLNREVLIANSRVIRNAESNAEKDVIDAREAKESNVNVYDDSDFYHQQLRELIEYKTNSSSNVTEVTKQIVELQKLRKNMKKKVDQRASKGRKTRYIVHNKLVNFIAPDKTSDNWTDESKNELYKSLFAT